MDLDVLRSQTTRFSDTKNQITILRVFITPDSNLVTFKRLDNPIPNAVLSATAQTTLQKIAGSIQQETTNQ